MQDVLVLGGTQFFGKRLVEKLIENGKNVTIATRGLATDNFGQKVKRLIIDREDKETLQKAFENKIWDVVYDQTCQASIEAFDSTEILNGKVKRYILTSSQAVYYYGTKHREDNFDPTSFSYSLIGRRDYVGYAGYQEAKRASEAIILNHKGFETVAVRFPIVIGKDDFTARLKFYVDKIISGQPIGVVKPEARFSFILSDEAAEFLYSLGESTFEGPINPGCRDDISIKELIQKIEKIVEKKAIVTHELTKDNASPYGFEGSWSINTDKAERQGNHFSDLNLTLNELIKYYKADI